MLPHLQFKGSHVTLFEDSLPKKKKKNCLKTITHQKTKSKHSPKLFMPIFYLFYLKQRSPKSSNLSSISSSSSPKSQKNPSKSHKSPLKAFLCISNIPNHRLFSIPKILPLKPFTRFRLVFTMSEYWWYTLFFGMPTNWRLRRIKFQGLRQFHWGDAMLYLLNGFWPESYRRRVDDTVCWLLFSILLLRLLCLCAPFGFIGVALHCFSV